MTFFSLFFDKTIPELPGDYFTEGYWPQECCLDIQGTEESPSKAEGTLSELWCGTTSAIPGAEADALSRTRAGLKVVVPSVFGCCCLTALTAALQMLFSLSLVFSLLYIHRFLEQERLLFCFLSCTIDWMCWQCWAQEAVVILYFKRLGRNLLAFSAWVWVLYWSSFNQSQSLSWE